MDKRWMDLPRHTSEYIQGVKEFIEYAFTHSAKANIILCPCKKCVNSCWKEVDDIYVHLICDGFLEGYKTWIFHGEPTSSFAQYAQQPECNEFAVDSSEEDNDMFELLNDLAHGLDKGDLGGNSDGFLDPSEVEKDLHELFGDTGKELYPGSKNLSKLSFIVKLLHIKFLGGWSDKSFDMLLELLGDAFPEGSTVPRNFNEAKKIIRCFGLGYVNIHACENDCILFRKKYENIDICPKCSTSRWKIVKKSPNGQRVHRVPRKVLRYFPVKKRLQKLFMSPKSATDAWWHDEACIRDGLMRHPADSPAWKHFDCTHPYFSKDSRNIRLALATDGFNPFRSMNCSYSIWPVILIPLNSPPWMCMKQPNFILSLLIPGPNSPGKDMDVYYEPLVDDLIDMWEEGVRTYDASRGENFQLYAAITSTITDFPGLGYCSGCVTSGKLACQHCNSETCSIRLKNGSKSCYMGHRRFLDPNHKFRFDVASFDGTSVVN